jgi:hypothetical protein
MESLQGSDVNKKVGGAAFTAQKTYPKILMIFL